MKIHFIGVGGIGISSLARHYLLSKENIVTGSDVTYSENIEDLENSGLNFYLNHSINNINKDIDLIIYSPAIKVDNIEVLRGKEFNIKIQSYPEALAELSENYFTIAISGTHGKSTTTAITAMVLEEAGLDPTVILGTKLKEFGNSNYKKGKSKYLLIEADEWNKSLLKYSPDIAVITNLEAEHLDTYKNLDDLIQTFDIYVNKIKSDGFLILNKDNVNLEKLKRKADYSFSKSDKIASEIKSTIQVPGNHNLENALAAYAIGVSLGLSKDKILSGIKKYKGSWRRFEEKEILINQKRHKIILDYAHHPTELKAVLAAIKEKYSKDKVIAIFQPHQYERSLNLKEDFIKVLNQNNLDKLFLTDIFSVPGRERDSIKKQISSKKIFIEISATNIDYLPGDLTDVSKKIKSILQEDEIIAIIGAGDIYKLENLLKI